MRIKVLYWRIAANELLGTELSTISIQEKYQTGYSAAYKALSVLEQAGAIKEVRKELNKKIFAIQPNAFELMKIQHRIIIDERLARDSDTIDENGLGKAKVVAKAHCGFKHTQDKLMMQFNALLKAVRHVD